MASRLFRETLWFKKGAAMSDAPTSPDSDAPSIGELPVEDRYLDDGSVTTDDTAAYGLHTKLTGPIPIKKKKRV